MAVTSTELNNTLQTELNKLGAGLAQNLVKYVEGKEAVLKTEL